MWKPIKSYNVAACMCKKVYSTLINLSTRLFVLPLPVAMNKTKKSQKVKFNELPSINQLLRSIKGILIHATRTWSIYFTKRMLELCRCIMRVWWQVEKLVSEVLFRFLSARSALSPSLSLWGWNNHKKYTKNCCILPFRFQSAVFKSYTCW